VNRYLNDVPEKNLKEIESAPQLKYEDLPLNKYFIKYNGSFESNTKWSHKRLYRKGIFVYHERIDSGNTASRAFTNETGLNCDRFSSDWKIEESKRRGLFIAAPKSHFDLKGLKQSSPFSFNIFTPVIQEDPIVFRYVKGGIQVLSKWGLEANDEELVNPITN
jgi:hypothetical protein